MGTLRDRLVRRQVRQLRQALASLYGATRHADDYRAVRITISDPETGEALDSMALQLLAFTELVDAVRARSTELLREQLPKPTTAEQIAQAATVLRLVQPDPTTNRTTK
ncbi:hypothetical protein ACWDPF_33560 [Streptomyces albogriseolus]